MSVPPMSTPASAARSTKVLLPWLIHSTLGELSMAWKMSSRPSALASNITACQWRIPKPGRPGSGTL